MLFCDQLGAERCICSHPKFSGPTRFVIDFEKCERLGHAVNYEMPKLLPHENHILSEF